MRFFYFPTFRTEKTPAPSRRLRTRVGCLILACAACGVALAFWHPWGSRNGYAELGISCEIPVWASGPRFGVVEVLGRVTLRHRPHRPAQRLPLRVVAFCDFPIDSQDLSYGSALGDSNVLIVGVYPRAPNEHVDDKMPLSMKGGVLRLRLPSRRHAAKPITIKTRGCQQFWVERDGSITVIRHPLTQAEIESFGEELERTGKPPYPTLQALKNRPKAAPSKAGKTQASPR